MELDVFRIQLATDEVAAEISRNLASGSAAHEWIEHYVARARACQNARLDQFGRETGEVRSAERLGRYSPHRAFISALRGVVDSGRVRGLVPGGLAAGGSYRP